MPAFRVYRRFIKKALAFQSNSGYDFTKKIFRAKKDCYDIALQESVRTNMPVNGSAGAFAYEGHAPAGQMILLGLRHVAAVFGSAAVVMAAIMTINSNLVLPKDPEEQPPLSCVSLPSM